MHKIRVCLSPYFKYLSFASPNYFVLNKDNGSYDIIGKLRMYTWRILHKDRVLQKEHLGSWLDYHMCSITSQCKKKNVSLSLQKKNSTLLHNFIPLSIYCLHKWQSSQVSCSPYITVANLWLSVTSPTEPQIYMLCTIIDAIIISLEVKRWIVGKITWVVVSLCIYGIMCSPYEKQRYANWSASLHLCICNAIATIYHHPIV